MFDFLNSGDEHDKKRELEENIEQIREKVQKEGGQGLQQDSQSTPSVAERGPAPNPPRDTQRDSATPQDRPAEPPAPADGDDLSEPQNADRTNTRTSDTVNRQQQDSPSTERSSSERQGPARRTADAGKNTSQKDERKPQSSEQQSQQPSQADHSKDSTDSGGLHGIESTKGDSKLSSDDVPKPPEVKDLDIPDIEKGPLFITVKKFKHALSALSEMEHLSNEIEEQVNSLEDTLEEDRETDTTLRRLLDETAQDTETIEDIVSPQ